MLVHILARLFGSARFPFMTRKVIKKSGVWISWDLGGAGGGRAGGELQVLTCFRFDEDKLRGTVLHFGEGSPSDYRAGGG